MKFNKYFSLQNTVTQYSDDCVVLFIFPRWQVCFVVFMSESSHCFQRVLAIATLSVRLSVTRVDQSKMVQARISKSSPSADQKTLVSGTVKLFCPKKLYTHYYPHLGVHHVVKFHGATFLSYKFMVAHTLHFMTILTPIAKKCWENPVPSGMCASKLWSFYNACWTHQLSIILSVQVCYRRCKVVRVEKF